MCRKGLRQGDGLSCLLFNIALEGVIRRAGLNMRGLIFTISSQLVCFADDIDVIGQSLETDRPESECVEDEIYASKRN